MNHLDTWTRSPVVLTFWKITQTRKTYFCSESSLPELTLVSSILSDSLYHLLLCLNTCVEALFFIIWGLYPLTKSVNRVRSLSTWYSAISRLPTIFSSSRSLFFTLSLVCIFDIESCSYFVMNFNEVCSVKHGRRKVCTAYRKAQFIFLIF